MTTQPPDLKKLTTLDGGKYTVVQHSDGRLEALRYGETWRDLTGDNLFLALLDAYEASARDAEALRAALEVEQVDLDFTIQAIVGRDPLEEIHLRVRDQKRRVTDALNAARHATQRD